MKPSVCERVFGVDPRSLALFRIGLGALLLADLIMRATDLVAHYTDRGVLPRSAVYQLFQGTGRWSVHMLSGQAPWQMALFAVAMISAICLMLGWHTRIATCLSWLLLVSVQARNPLVVNGGDVLLRLLVLWSVFLPLESCWSMDARRHSPAMPRSIVSCATAAIQLQVALMYWMTAYFKFQGNWHHDAMLAQTLRFDSYARPLAGNLLEYPRLVDWFGYGVPWLELLGPMLVFSPVATKSIRLTVIALFFLLHLGIELTMTVGLFSYTSWLAWSLFLPDSFWNFGVVQKLVVGFRHPPHPTFPPLSPLRGAGKNNLFLDRCFWSRPANETEPRCAAAGNGRPSAFRWLRETCAGFLLAYVVLWNLADIPELARINWMPPSWRGLGELLAVRQKWNMFSGRQTRDGWFVVVGRLADGQLVDLLRDGAPADWDSYEKPAHVYRQFPNHRWRKLYRRLVSSQSARYRKPLCRYYAVQWNVRHPENRCHTVELHYMQELDPDEPNSDLFQQRFLQTLKLDSRR